MNIPALITEHQKKVTITGLKKAYSVIQNAKELSENENGSMDMWMYPGGYYDYSSDTVEQFVRKYYLPYFQSAKECVGFDCFNKIYTPNPVTLNGQTMHGLMYEKYFVILPDGMILNFFPNLNAGYFWLFVDINGYKKPNRVGRDIFVFDIYKYASNEYKIKFWGDLATRERLLNTVEYSCNPNASRYAGFVCGQLILHDSWQISDDYPWKN